VAVQNCNHEEVVLNSDLRCFQPLTMLFHQMQRVACQLVLFHQMQRVACQPDEKQNI
jgi:hypothetical protein